ncbi:LytTR family transcriptional regulator DNA-binding domain-containing protein [Jiulongibacter sp. NS-SX5]|uniref:LytTR family transcriptional regulator DNA-binding domain-containing protein n=1 Tax=Jiulongibacter sp. NS-SX5 TaxID=3463854 RepID=UPI004058CD4B
MKTINRDGKHYILLNHGSIQLDTSQIRYIEGDGNYSHLYLKNKAPILSSFTMKLFSDELERNSQFFSPRKGLLLNLSFLQDIIQEDRSYTAIMKNGDVLKLSRRRGKALMSFLKEQH